MNRDELYRIVVERSPSQNLTNHMLAVEAIMRTLAEHFHEDADKWGIAGLVHDIDYVETKDTPNLHSIVGSEQLHMMGLSEDICYAVRVHNERHRLPRKSMMDKALYAADPISGLIVACALVRPEKRLDLVDTDFVMLRFKEKRFAAGANRDQILSCQELGIDLYRFVSLCLTAMKGIAADIGL
ncbi:MAG: HD domain-containing protein [Caldisericota bacterium]|jgi:putative nucleotidyltransferase with HDIG domain|nr:HD domain-containing protein [Caldisericota bacterium]